MTIPDVRLSSEERERAAAIEGEVLADPERAAFAIIALQRSADYSAADCEDCTTCGGHYCTGCESECPYCAEEERMNQ